MNHPLPQNSTSTAVEYTFVDAAIEARPEEKAVPSRFDKRVAEPAEIIEAASSDSDDPYEKYRQRIFEHQQQQRDYVRSAMPQPPERPQFQNSAARYESYYNTRQNAPQVTFPEFEDMGSIRLGRRGISRNMVLAGIAAIVAGASLGLGMANFDHVSSSTANAIAYVGSILPADYSSTARSLSPRPRSMWPTSPAR
jgi:hypothetical protein